MNTLKAYLRYNSPEYAAFLNKNAKIAQVIVDNKDKIQSSVFKGRIEIDILAWSQYVAIVPIVAYSLSNVNKVNAYTDIYYRLMNVLRSTHPIEECDLSDL